jgi:hypothetical protein
MVFIPTLCLLHQHCPSSILGQTAKSSKNEVGSWELKASRKALCNMKSLQLVHTYYKGIICESNGQYKKLKDLLWLN